MSSKQSTRQQLQRIPNLQNLYRHVNGTYYGIKKVGSKRKEHSFRTSDRKLAERRLKQWIQDLEKVDTSMAGTTLDGLIKKFNAANAGKSKKTIQTNDSIIEKLRSTWRHGLTVRIVDIRASQLSEWLAQHEQRIKNSTYNRYAGVLKQMFEIALADQIIAQSPFESVLTKWKKPQKPIRRVPTPSEFTAIINHVRNRKFNASAKDSADFLEFLGLAGLGQAEASSLTWGAIDWKTERIAIRRHKTQNVFYVPLYPHLKPLLERLATEAGECSPEMRVFKIKDAKKALDGACTKLDLSHFSQRNIRAVLIQRLWQAGVDVKLIAKWQGHQDGGKLILDTYTEVFGSNDESYEQQQLKKIA